MKKQNLSKIDKLDIRKRIFIHLDGWVVCPTITILNENLILNSLTQKDSISLNELLKNHPANEGYLNIALRTMASQGYLVRTVDNASDSIWFSLTENGCLAIKLASSYMIFNKLIIKLIVRPKNIFSLENFTFLSEACKYLYQFQKDFTNPIAYRMKLHMEGILLGAIMINISLYKKTTLLKEQKLSPSLFKINKSQFELLINLLKNADFIEQKNTLNSKGVYYFKRISSYGVTISYLPILSNLQKIIFGDPSFLWKKDKFGHERHVYRYMNVWGSGGAHKSYFNLIDQIIVDIFNKPIDQQPKGLIDIGCGDATLLIHLFKLIKNKTIRGKYIKTYPLIIIGVDYNKKARIVSKDNLNKAKIKANIFYGDISNPNKINTHLIEKLKVSLNELLNIRTFLDHNRIYKRPNQVLVSNNSDAAFAFKGRRIPNNELFQNLCDHLKSWMPFIQTYGLLIVELHTIPSKIAALNIGNSLSTPYDATHGYSDQYILELSSFLAAVKEVGLKSVKKYLHEIPEKSKATISIQLIKK